MGALRPQQIGVPSVLIAHVCHSPDTTDVTGQYMRWKGTGMAAAQAAGAAALMISINSEVIDHGDFGEFEPRPDRAAPLRQILSKTARRVEKGARPNPTTGWGEIDAKKAVAKAKIYKPVTH